MLVADVAALLTFVTIGLVSHHHGFLRGYARDVPTFVGAWVVAAIAFGLYRRPERRRLVATWAVGVSAAVFLRMLLVGHHLTGSEAAFLLVSLVTIGVLVPAFRWAVTRLSPQALPGGRAPRR